MPRNLPSISSRNSDAPEAILARLRGVSIGEVGVRFMTQSSTLFPKMKRHLFQLIRNCLQFNLILQHISPHSKITVSTK